MTSLVHRPDPKNPGRVLWGSPAEIEVMFADGAGGAVLVANAQAPTAARGLGGATWPPSRRPQRGPENDAAAATGA